MYLFNTHFAKPGDGGDGEVYFSDLALKKS